MGTPTDFQCHVEGPGKLSRGNALVIVNEKSGLIKKTEGRMSTPGQGNSLSKVERHQLPGFIPVLQAQVLKVLP